MISFTPIKNAIITGLILVLSTGLYAQDFSFREKKEFKNDEAYPYDARFSPFRKFFALTWSDNRVELYDRNWEKVFQHQGNPKSGPGKLSFSPDGEFLAFSRYKSFNDIGIIQLSDMKVFQVLMGHSDKIYELAFNRKGDFLASSGADETIRLWHFDNNKFNPTQVLHDPFRGYKSLLYGGLDFSMDDHFLASGGSLQQSNGKRNKKISIYRLAKGGYSQMQLLGSGEGAISDIEFSPLNNSLISCSKEGLDSWNYHDDGFKQTDSTRSPINATYFLSVSPTGTFLACDGGGDFFKGNIGKNVLVFKQDKTGYKIIKTIYQHTGTVHSGNFSDDGKFLVTCSEDKSAIVWEVTGVAASDRSLLAEYLNFDLTLAQKKILTPSVLQNILKRLPPDLTTPRDEFETSATFNERRKNLADLALSLLQENLEKAYKIRREPGSMVKINLQELIGYNADKQIYKVKFLEIEGGVQIPIEPARYLKKNWEKAYILARKTRKPGETAYVYSDFRLIHPGNGKSYPVTPTGNPFRVSNEKTNAGMLSTGNQSLSGATKQTQSGKVPMTRALLFATNIYDSFSELVNPVLDARTLAAELSDNYQCKVELIENPTLNETIKKIREYAKIHYQSEDQLFIFFAGHGIFDNVFKEGYVISKDSKPSDETKTSYLSHSNLRTMVNNIPCNHIFLAMDVCFGGTFDPLLAAKSRAVNMYEDITTNEFIQRKSKYKTRLYLTSGGKEYVPDGRPGHHSPFMRKFLEALRNYGGEDGIITMNELLPYIEKVSPQPHFGEFGNNEPGSDFLFVSK